MADKTAKNNIKNLGVTRLSSKSSPLKNNGRKSRKVIANFSISLLWLSEVAMKIKNNVPIKLQKRVRGNLRNAIRKDPKVDFRLSLENIVGNFSNVYESN